MNSQVWPSTQASGFRSARRRRRVGTTARCRAGHGVSFAHCRRSWRSFLTPFRWADGGRPHGRAVCWRARELSGTCASPEPSPGASQSATDPGCSTLALIARSTALVVHILPKGQHGLRWYTMRPPAASVVLAPIRSRPQPQRSSCAPSSPPTHTRAAPLLARFNAHERATACTYEAVATPAKADASRAAIDRAGRMSGDAAAPSQPGPSRTTRGPVPLSCCCRPLTCSTTSCHRWACVDLCRPTRHNLPRAAWVMPLADPSSGQPRAAHRATLVVLEHLLGHAAAVAHDDEQARRPPHDSLRPQLVHNGLRPGARAVDLAVAVEPLRKIRKHHGSSDGPGTMASALDGGPHASQTL